MVFWLRQIQCETKIIRVWCSVLQWNYVLTRNGSCCIDISYARMLWHTTVCVMIDILWSFMVLKYLWINLLYDCKAYKLQSILIKYWSLALSSDDICWVNERACFSSVSFRKVSEESVGFQLMNGRRKWLSGSEKNSLNFGGFLYT